MAKAFNLTFDYVLYEMSYINVIMYSSVLTAYDTDDKKDEVIDGDSKENQNLLSNIINNS